MPGSSLWLVPPEDSLLYQTIHHLILKDMPSLFPHADAPAFTPHVTLTADTVLTAGATPQQWLDSISLPPDDASLEVTIRELRVGTIFFRKLTLTCEKTSALAELAAHCRAARGSDEDVQQARGWITHNYMPHCSLMYSDLPYEDVTAGLAKATETVQAAQRGAPRSSRTKGAAIWLVATNRPLSEWAPLAKREFKNVEWIWEI